MPGIDYRRDVLNRLVAALRQLDTLPVDAVDAGARGEAARHVRTILTRDLTSHYMDTPARSRVELLVVWLTAQNRTAAARELRQRVRRLLRDVDAWARREAAVACEAELRRAEWDNVVDAARELSRWLEMLADAMAEPDVVPQCGGGDEARDRVPPMHELVAVADLRGVWPQKGKNGVKRTSTHLANWLRRHKCDVHAIGGRNYIRIADALAFWPARSNTHEAIRKICHADDDQQ